MQKEYKSKKEDKKVKKRKNIAFPLRINDQLKTFLTQKAEERGITRNTLITNLLWEYKEKVENEQKNR